MEDDDGSSCSSFVLSDSEDDASGASEDDDACSAYDIDIGGGQPCWVPREVEDDARQSAKRLSQKRPTPPTVRARSPAPYGSW